MSRWTAFWKEQHGAVSIYLLLILIPLFLFCGLLIDVARWKTAEKEAENAVKAGVRSTLSAFSERLQSYGLYALEPDSQKSQGIFERTVAGNLSDAAESSSFRFIDQRFEAGTARLTPMYALSNHEVLKRQILEEMKYRAPMIFALEMTDKFQKTGLAPQLSQGSQFSEKAAKIEKPLEERDQQLEDAWDTFLDIRQKAKDMHPFYQTQLRDLNELSERIGIHTVEEVRTSLQNAKTELQSLVEQIRGIDGSIMSLAMAGAGAAESIRQLSLIRMELQSQAEEAQQKISEFEQLLNDLLRYAQLLTMLKLKSANDYADLSRLNDRFQEAMKATIKANDELNAELASITADSAGALEADRVFSQIRLIDRSELDEITAGVSASISLFSGVHAQIQDSLLFTSQKYANTIGSLDGFLQKTEELFAKFGSKQAERKEKNASVRSAKREQRNKTQLVLDQIKRGLGSCSLVSGADPFEGNYNDLLGNSSASDSKGFYQTYLELNQASNASSAAPQIDLKNADQAGLSAMKLMASVNELLSEVRDEFYIDEFAVSKFSYRTLGLEKDRSGGVKTSKERSNPESHALTNQELEFLLYGSHSCAGNYSMAYAEMFAFRLAVGVTEALLEPKNEVLAAGSPLLVLLTAVAEGAFHAQQDMAKLIEGEQVPLSRRLSSSLTLGYKDYLRIFMVLHSPEPVLLSRLQALLQLNTGIDLREATTYVSGSASTSFRLWFLPAVMKSIEKTGFSGCSFIGGRCQLTKSADFTY